LGANNQSLVDHTQNRAIEFATALTLPATVALFVIPTPIIAVLFERGAFSAADTAATAPALAAYAVGLPAFVAIKVLQPSYFAREDTSTPMWSGAVSMVVNVAAAFALFYYFGHVGIASATSLAAWVNTIILVVVLRRRGQLNSDAALRRRLPLLALASVLMGAVVYGAAWAFAPWLVAHSLIVRAASMVGLVTIGVVFFAAFCQLTGVVDFRRVFAEVKPRRRNAT
jgi:putative peptidoglycan lipid II flippase